MTIRTAASAALFSALVLASGASFAASPASVADQIRETKAALSQSLPGGMGRTEQLQAERNLSIAESLNRQGRAAEAQGYLNYARGALDIPFRQSAAGTPTASAPTASFSVAQGDFGSIYR